MHTAIALANSYFANNKSNDITFLEKIAKKNYHLILYNDCEDKFIYAFHENEIKLTDELPESANYIQMNLSLFDGILARRDNPIIHILNGNIKIHSPNK